MNPASQPPAADGAAHRDIGQRPPSPPWYGGVAAVLFFASFGWIFAYTLGPAPGLGGLGGWNYAAAAGLFVISAAMIRSWRAG